jgi:hypothetical protein
MSTGRFILVKLTGPIIEQNIFNHALGYAQVCGVGKMKTVVPSAGRLGSAVTEVLPSIERIRCIVSYWPQQRH